MIDIIEQRDLGDEHVDTGEWVIICCINWSTMEKELLAVQMSYCELLSMYGEDIIPSYYGSVFNKSEEEIGLLLQEMNQSDLTSYKAVLIGSE